MRFISMFAVTGRLVALTIAKPIPNLRAGGMTIPLTRHSSSLDSNENIDIDIISSHAISVREKILSGLGNYEMNTGTMHPFAPKRSESKLAKRGVSIPLTTYRNWMWMGEISIGTPPQTFNVHIDTGAADTWVMQSGCGHGMICGDRALWDPSLSESAEYQGQPFWFQYGDGSVVEGDRYTDNVTIAGFTADPQTFGSATSSSVTQGTHGLLGLAFPSISSFHADPLFESLVGQGKLINPTFSLKLSSSGAEMCVGGANSMLYNGEITYTPVTDPGFWQVSMDDVRVNGNKILENVPAIFDSGANYIIGDFTRVSEFYRSLGGTFVQRQGFGFYHLPCDSFPTLSFTFTGRSFEISPEVFRHRPIAKGSPNCFGAIIAECSDIEFWSIGIPFLQGVYSVFDYSTLQVGFADLA